MGKIYQIESADEFGIKTVGGWKIDGTWGECIAKPELRTDSLAVARVFGKRHKNILQAIRNMECPDDFRRLNFQPADFLDEQGKPRPLVTMTQKGFEFLVLGFTGKKAAMFRAAYIERFHAMEEALESGTAGLVRQAWAFPPETMVGVQAAGEMIGRVMKNPGHQEPAENVAVIVH
jgi:Rha family phage regulatory protein